MSSQTSWYLRNSFRTYLCKKTKIFWTKWAQSYKNYMSVFHNSINAISRVYQKAYSSKSTECTDAQEQCIMHWNPRTWSCSTTNYFNFMSEYSIGMLYKNKKLLALQMFGKEENKTLQNLELHYKSTQQMSTWISKNCLVRWLDSEHFDHIWEIVM